MIQNKTVTLFKLKHNPLCPVCYRPLDFYGSPTTRRLEYFLCEHCETEQDLTFTPLNVNPWASNPSHNAPMPGTLTPGKERP